MNRINGGILLLSFLICSFNSGFAQQLSKKEFIRAVQSADVSFYYDEDYEKAAKAYESLLKDYPDNVNLAAKLGICFLNIDGKNQEALSLLKKAYSNIVENDKDYVEYGDKAPLDTYLYLALAYDVNDSLDKALSSFYNARSKLSKTGLFREQYIDNQIRDCQYAIEMKKKPVTVIPTLFAPWLSKYPGACNPVLTKNDSVFIFTQVKNGKTRIFISLRDDDWKLPVDITQQLGGYDRLYTNSATANGRYLVLSMDDGGDGNLYFSRQKGSKWTKIKSMGKPVNSSYWESHGFITPDGSKLYFSSNRPGGQGDLDIWISERKNDGSWNAPVNCGKVINTPFNEDTPFFDPATNTLFYSSVGLTGMGGYDVFRSVLKNGVWTKPAGLPYAFNTTDKNLFFIPDNASQGFITSMYNYTTHSRNIYSEVAVDPSDELTTAKGTVNLGDGMQIEYDKINIRLEGDNNNTLVQNVPVDSSGSFKFTIKPGDYKVFISHAGYKTDTVDISLPLHFMSHYMVINSTLIPEKVAEGLFFSIKNILFDFNSYGLNDSAKSELEAIRSLLINYPDLKIEVAGYTDSKGSPAYNMKLAHERAGAVINYLVSDNIPQNRFVEKAFGESNFIASNTRQDGSDNPEGRKYNRRVAFGIVDPHTGVIIRQETYTPEYLRIKSSFKYSIILQKSRQKLSPDYFNFLNHNERIFLRTIESDSVVTYTIGIFYNKPDADKFLQYVKDSGIDGAYIVNQYDLRPEIETSAHIIPVVSSPGGDKTWTVQLIATRSPVDPAFFHAVGDTHEVKGEDGFYRYITGKYDRFRDARDALNAAVKAGFPDAFIRELDLLLKNDF